MMSIVALPGCIAVMRHVVVPGAPTKSVTGAAYLPLPTFTADFCPATLVLHEYPVVTLVGRRRSIRSPGTSRTCAGNSVTVRVDFFAA